jgi:dTDP-4-dehydrorhamnose reductase
MRVLILGSTGLLGQALVNEATKRGYQVIGIARNEAKSRLDITNAQALENLIIKSEPSVIINTVAIVNLQDCEQNPGLAYLTNTRPSGVISNLGCKLGFYSVQISTDHYFTGDADTPHSESSPVTLLNEYARTKYLAEILATRYVNTLVLRTNIVGFRHKKGSPTFIEWVINSLIEKRKMTLFDDFFTSSIDVRQFSKSCFDLIIRKTTGVLNLASREVTSKKVFIETLARRLGRELNHTRVGSIKELNDGIVRANSLGLDVSSAESILGYQLPTLSMVIESILTEYEADKNDV